MAAKDGGGDEVGNFRSVVPAALDEVQRIEAQLLACGLIFERPLGIPLGRVGVEIPAVVVNAPAALRELGEERANLGDSFLFEMQKAYNDVGNLDAGVVNVVLHVDFVAGGTEETDKCVAEDRVAEMTDVRGLVGIDAGVLNERVPTLERRIAIRREDQPRGRSAIEIRIDIPSAGHLEFCEAGKRSECGDDFLGDDLRSFAQFARQLERNRRGDLAHTQLGRSLDRDRANLQIVFFFEDGAKTIGEPLFKFENHAMSLSEMLDFPCDFSIRSEAATQRAAREAQ